MSNPDKETKMKNKVVLFEIPASDLKKAKTFYETIFDWKVDLWEDEGAIALTTAVDKNQQPTEIGGINGESHKRKAKDNSTSFGEHTDPIKTCLKTIEKGRGKIVTPKHSIGEWGFMADFADPEGNVIALWEKPIK